MFFDIEIGTKILHFTLSDVLNTKIAIVGQ